MHDFNTEPDTRVTEIDPIEHNDTAAPASVQAHDARVLTIPGAVYRSTVEHSGYTDPTPSSDQASDTPAYQTPTATVVQEAPAPIYSEAVADEASDDLPIPAPLPILEPQSKAAVPSVADPAEDDSYVSEADYARTVSADDAGHYTVHTEHESDVSISGEPHPIGVPYDPSHEEEEYTRFLAEQEQKRSDKRTKKRTDLAKDVDKLYLPVDAIDKNVQLVEARMLFEIESMKLQHRMLGYTFSQDVLKRERTERRLRRQINNRMYRLSRALKRERSDNTRYYTAALDRYHGDPGKRESSTATVAAILDRLDYTLKERDRLTDKLLTLYNEATPDSRTGKESRVAERAARAAYRSQLKDARRLARMHAPTELKERIYTLMNERVTMLSSIEKNRYLLSKKRYTGTDKRAAKRQNKDMKRALRRIENETYELMKRAQKHDQNHSGGIRQLAWLVGTLVLLGAIGALYFLGKYYWGWF